MNSKQIIDHFGLEPLPEEGGYFRRIFTHPETLPGTEQALSSAIYFLITAEQFSALHRIASWETFHFLWGAPVSMLHLLPGGGHSLFRLGQNVDAGEEPVLTVPAGVWQGCRLADPAAGPGYAFFSVTVSPEFQWDALEIGSRVKLGEAWPEAAAEIAVLTRG